MLDLMYRLISVVLGVVVLTAHPEQVGLLLFAVNVVMRIGLASP